MSEALKARCFDKDWKYVKHSDHDLHKSMARYKRMVKEAAEAKPPANVKSIKLAKGAKS